jgi:hypothetical protein
MHENMDKTLIKDNDFFIRTRKIDDKTDKFRPIEAVYKKFKDNPYALEGYLDFLNSFQCFLWMITQKLFNTMTDSEVSIFKERIGRTHFIKE